MKTGKSYIAAGLFNGRPFNAPNDLTIDRQGRVFFTDPRYLGHESIDQPVMGVYRLDTDGSVHLIAANVWKPNGIALSPDEQKLYVVSVGDYGTDLLTSTPPRGSVPSQVHAYGLQTDGTVRYEKPLLTFAPGSWGDGMTVDRAGNIYVAVTGAKDKNGVYVFASGGERIAFLATPEPAINVDFGVGATANTLYVACEHGLYEIQLRQSAPHAFAP
jgi:gluconolactonase